VKASALESAIDDARRFVRPDSRILPILNGMAQIDLLEAAFPGQVIGGAAKIVATLDGAVVRQMTDLTTLTIGVPEGGHPPVALVDALDVPGIRLEVSDDILGALWEKWMFIAAASIVTCLFRNAVGPIIEAGGLPSILRAIDETESVARAAGHPVSARAHDQALALLTEPGSGFTTSLYRDLIAGLPTEAEHILGDLARRARELDIATPLLDLVLVQVRAAEATR
jgi:2-dehydropantoate 2-reductase